MSYNNRVLQSLMKRKRIMDNYRGGEMDTNEAIYNMLQKKLKMGGALVGGASNRWIDFAQEYRQKHKGATMPAIRAAYYEKYPKQIKVKKPRVKGVTFRQCKHNAVMDYKKRIAEAKRALKRDLALLKEQKQSAYQLCSANKRQRKRKIADADIDLGLDVENLFQ